VAGKLLFNEEPHGSEMSSLGQNFVVTRSAAGGLAERPQGSGEVVPLYLGKNAVRSGQQIRF
jgi:hypothetical protein